MIPTASLIVAITLFTATVAAGSLSKEQLAASNPLARFDGPKRRPRSSTLKNILQHRSKSGAKPNPAFIASLAAQANPAVVNWVTAGGVTPIQNEGECGGACVAFTVTGNIEGVNFATNGKLVPLSAQEVVSCAMADGCDGGWPIDADYWFTNNTGGKVCTAASFPFNSSSGNTPPCTTKCTTGAVISDVIALPQDENIMASSVAQNGPIAVAVDADSWELYTGGVFTNCTYSSLDHTAVVVGYNDNHNPPYWLIKNSWGTAWGENGYIRVAKGSNQCGINMDALTVRVRRT